MVSDRKTSVCFFEDIVGENAFSSSFSSLLRSIYRDTNKRLIPPENSMHLRHGGSWSHPGLPNAYQSGMQTHTSTATVSLKEIVNHDLTAIGRCVESLTNAMQNEIARSVYGSLSAACDLSGNVVDAKQYESPLDAVLKMFEQVDFFVGKNGKVQLPEIHTGPATYLQLQEYLKSAPPDFSNRLEAIKSQKTAEAIEREAIRKARFMHYGNSQCES